MQTNAFVIKDRLFHLREEMVRGFAPSSSVKCVNNLIDKDISSWYTVDEMQYANTLWYTYVKKVWSK